MSQLNLKRIELLKARLVFIANERRMLAEEMGTISKELESLSPVPNFESRAFRTEVTKTMFLDLTEENKGVK